MSDTDTDSLSHPRRSDSESERHGKSAISTTIRNRGSNVSPNSVDFEQFESSTKLGNSLPTRSTHTPSNRVGSVPLEEVGSCKGEKLLASPTLTHPRRDTPPTLSCHCGWAMGRGRGQPKVGANFATMLRSDKFN